MRSLLDLAYRAHATGQTMSARCCRCAATAGYQVTGANYDTPVLACEQHLGQVQRAAGVPRSTVGVVDDGQEGLFEMPERAKTGGRGR